MTEPQSDTPTDTGTAVPDGPRSLALSWKARIGVTVAIAVALGLFVIGGLRTNTDADPEAVFTGITEEGAPTENVALGIERFLPPPGSNVFGQQPFGVDLEVGWTAELTFLPSQGVEIPIPRDQLDITEELALVVYTPGDGKVIERLEGDRFCVRAVVWDRTRPREASERTEEWCFSNV